MPFARLVRSLETRNQLLDLARTLLAPPHRLNWAILVFKKAIDAFITTFLK